MSDRFCIEPNNSSGSGGGNQIVAGQGLLSDVNNGTQTLSLDPAAAGSGQWAPLVVYQLGGAMGQFHPSIGYWLYANYGANSNAVVEGSWDMPLARAQSAGKMTFRLEYINDSTLQLRCRRRRRDTDSWARFSGSLVQYRAASVRDNSNQPFFGAWQQGNPVPLVASDTWCWYEIELTTLPDDEISFHFYPDAGVVNWAYMRLYVKI